MLAAASRWISRWLVPAALTGYCAIHLAGCVAIPVPTASADPEPFTAERMTPIRIGKTTRDEARALFANWSYETDDGTQTAHIEPQIAAGGRYWVFSLPRQTGNIAWVGFLLDPAGLVPGVFGKGDNYEDYWVLLEFADNSTVARFWIASGKKPCAVGSACYHGGYLQVIADAKASVSAHASPPPGDRCVIYVYADNDFEMPVTVTDATRTGALLAKTTFVRFDVATGPASPSAWYENIPGSAATVPVNCAGGEVHYLAVRPREGLIEFMPVAASTGNGAIEKRFLLERLVTVLGSVAPERQPTLWTNCTAEDPCRELASVDIGSSYLVPAIVDAAGQMHEMPRGLSHLLLKPGRYTMEWSSTTINRQQRHDTFDLLAGRRYRRMSLDAECGVWKHFKSKAVRALDCREWRSETGEPVRSLRTIWVEEAATKRVVAGEKWCSSDSDCPASRCLAAGGQPLGICDIAELQCAYGESCKPR
jgi:hypothetical protein